MAYPRLHPGTTRHNDAEDREWITAHAHPLSGGPNDHDPLLEQIGDASLVLIGEGTHGTEEFYRERVAITRRLIEERGFSAVAVEADWPDAFRVNRYVRNHSDDRTPVEALDNFNRFPQWMWRNTIVRDFVGWLREYNDAHQAQQVGFYGLDLYSLHASIQSVITYLDKVDPIAADRARERYSCFEHFGEDSQAYGIATSLGAQDTCEDEVVEQLMEFHARAGELAIRNGEIAGDEFFSAQQNARLAMNAEAYYRAMFHGRVSSWNLRDTHMAETLDALIDHLSHHSGTPAKVVVWAHNSHLGDARATEMGDNGEVNLGQLARERHPGKVFLIGQSTFDGRVTAASNWHESPSRKRIRPGLPGSYEALFHSIEHGNFMLPLRGSGDRLRSDRLQRAIGVIYRPETERLSHYFNARVADQFDAVLHFDRTRALVPLEPTREWHSGDAPETWPYGDEPLP